MATRRKRGPAAGGRLLPPADGAVVRFYRIGHGDCFLLAFAGKRADAPVYVLIDCGYKPGSPQMIEPATNADDIVADIVAATGGRIDVAVITHEHQDHVNGITEERFSGLEIGETWLAWTEEPDDPLAKELRRKHRDTLLGLLEARNQLAADGDTARVSRLDEFLSLELGEAPAGTAAAFDAQFGASANKRSMKVLVDAAQDGPQYLHPHTVRPVPRTKDVRAYVLGPPRDLELLESLDPTGDEEFHALRREPRGARDVGSYFAAAVRAAEHGEEDRRGPFASRFGVSLEVAIGRYDALGELMRRRYGKAVTQHRSSRWESEVPDDAEWRRIEHDWLRSADGLAIALGRYTNNSSLVLAFELGLGGKVLLFCADAQRGNWLSWADKDWRAGRRQVTARDLLARTVLYKVGHHGSHNATLNGRRADKHPNLDWMGLGTAAAEFTAMITAVRAWAEGHAGWDHPYGPIKAALLRKSQGRVLQTDTAVQAMQAPAGVAARTWQAFERRLVGTELYFDLAIERSELEDDGEPGIAAAPLPVMPIVPVEPEPFRRPSAESKRSMRYDVMEES